MSGWKQCKNKPKIREVREVRPDERGVETLEGYKEVDSKTHFVMKGVKGEIYPIRKDIFEETYEMIE